MNRLTCAVSGIVVLLAVLASSGTREAAGQFRITTTEEPSSKVGIGPLFETDQRKVRLFQQAKKLAEQGNYTLSIQILQKILDSKQDSLFYEDEDKKNKFLSLKTEALRILGALPPKGQAAYELKYGLQAKQLLKEAVNAGDISGIEEVARRYFHTQAGYKATYLIGTCEMDRSNSLAAALEFDRLRKIPRARQTLDLEPMLSLKAAVCWGRAGLPNMSVKSLLDLKNATPGNTLTIGGKRIYLFDGKEDALKWLVATLGGLEGFQTIGQEKWTMFRGNPSRTAISSKASPVWDSLWTTTTVRDAALIGESPALFENIQKRLDDLVKKRIEKGLLALPAVHPLIVGNRVIARSVRNLYAHDLNTGELQWKTVVDDPYLKKFLPQATSGISSISSTLDMVLSQRAWGDVTAGTLSGDGQYIYSVEEVGYINPRLTINTQTRVRTTTKPVVDGLNGYNLLTAFEAETGLLKWNIGGPAGENSLLLGGTFFLGPPLPIGGRLFCLAETRGEIRMIVLDPDTGNPKKPVAVVWSQPLVNPKAKVTKMGLRRLAGLSPSYGGGVLVCPTSAGAVVALGPARRMLLWGYSYEPKSSQGNAPPNRFGGFQAQQVSANDDDGRWTDSAPTIAGGRVILTPRDSDEIHCVSMLDGSLLWKQSRDGGLYVAAVHSGKVIVVGKSVVKAIRLSDGKLAWKQSTELPTPSGRGFQTEGYYHLPLSTGEIATINLSSGRIVARSKTRSGQVLGNLVSANGSIVAQSHDRLVGFKPFDQLQKEINAQMAANPNSHLALAVRGEMRLHSGDEKGGLADLRRSISIKTTPRAQSLVVASLLEGIRVDFTGYRKYAPEIERLLNDPDQRSRYLGDYAAGLHEVGELRAAFSKYLQLAGPDTGKLRNIRSEGSLIVRSDRWVQSRINNIFQAAAKDQRIGMNKEIQTQFEAATKAGTPEALRKFLGYFSSMPKGVDARRELVSKLEPGTAALEMEFHLHSLRQSSDLKTSGFATARLASMLLSRKRPDYALKLYHELNGKYRDVICEDGKTGKQIAAKLGLNPQITTEKSKRSPWPEKRFFATRTSKPRGSTARIYHIGFEGARGPYFQNWSFTLDTRTRMVNATDADGKRRWTFPIGTGSYSSYYGNSVRAHGHLLVVTLANRFMVLDTLTPTGTPKVLWSRNLYVTPPGKTVNRGIQIRAVVAVGGRQKFIINGPQGQTLGKIGPITSEMIIYQVAKKIYAADPLTGKLLWQRAVSKPGCHLFGDHKHIFVVPSQSPTQAIVMRGIDGAKVGQRTIVSVASQISTQGQYSLTWRRSGNNYLLTYTDVLAEKVVWQKQFSEQAKIDLIKNDEVAIIEPTLGRFTVIDMQTGKTRVDDRIESDPGINHIIVRRSNDRYVLLTYNPQRNPKNVRAAAIVYTSPLVNGFAYGFNRKTGKRIWTTMIEQQSIELSQPENLPVLVFASRVYVNQNKIVAGGPRRSSYYVLSIDLLDTRNGRNLFAYKGRQSIYPYVLTVDPVKKTIDVNFYQTAVMLKMSQSPINSPNRYTKPIQPAVKLVKKPVDGAKPVGQKLGKVGAAPVAQPVRAVPAVRQIEIQRKR